MYYIEYEVKGDEEDKRQKMKRGPSECPLLCVMPSQQNRSIRGCCLAAANLQFALFLITPLSKCSGTTASTGGSSSQL